MFGRALFVAALVVFAPTLAQAQAGASLDAPAPARSAAVDAPLAAQLPSLDAGPNASDQAPRPLPRHPVGFVATGIPMVLVGLGGGIPSAVAAAQPGCSGGWFCLDFRPIFGALAAVGGVLFVVGLGLLIHGGSRWAAVDRVRDERARAGDLVLDGSGIGVRF